jgi:protein-tyrosine kinase
MSRIHEALKKAQEERQSAGFPQGVTTQEPETVMPIVPESRTAVAERLADLKPMFSQPSVTFAASVTAAPAITTAPPVAPSLPLTAETLETRLSQRDWNSNPMATLAESHANAREVFRTLRSRLYQMRDQQPSLRTILIASALPEEGKTFIASNLAQSIVRQADRRVLLIDADLRRANLSTFVGAPKGLGLVDYLMGEVDEAAVVQRGPQRSLFFVPAGSLVQNAAELLGNGRFGQLINRMAPLFDWIIVDSAPTIPIADSRIVSGFCDGVLMVVRAGATPFDIAQKACQSFQNKPILGVILNKIETRKADSSYAGAYEQSY